ncbi:MAG: sigma-70 family RNA polymerase sigma factor, partial [Actinobacteria bacterium]
MGPPERDEELIRRFLLGDADAFERLVERHRQRVFNLCLRILGDREDAADAAQETFLSVLTKLRQFRGDAAFTTWMHRVTVNACHDLSRKRRREPLLRLASDQDLPEAELAPPVPDHAEEMAGTLDAVAALKVVPEEFRVALVLADLHDLA